MFKKFFQRLVNRAVQEQTNREKFDRIIGAVSPSSDGPSTNRIRQFTIHEALNGHYIEYMRRKYNPNGPDDYVREIYFVQPGEALIDAIAAVLVILEK